MSKLEKHQKIITAILEEYASYKPAYTQNIDNQMIVDYQNNHYQLTRIGWSEDEDFIYQLIFHFDIKSDGKIWIQANWTDLDIAAELIAKGVDRNDIVIGFQPPSYRQYTGYAVA